MVLEETELPANDDIAPSIEEIPDYPKSDQPTAVLSRPVNLLSKSANNSEGASASQDGSEGLEEGSQDGLLPIEKKDIPIRTQSASPTLLPTARGKPVYEATEAYGYGTEQHFQPSGLMAPGPEVMASIPEGAENCMPSASSHPQPAPQALAYPSQPALVPVHALQSAPLPQMDTWHLAPLLPTDASQSALQHQDDHGPQEVIQASGIADAAHPSSNDQSASQAQTGWKDKGSFDPLHGQMYRHSSANNKARKAPKERDHGHDLLIPSPSSQSAIRELPPDTCLNLSRTGPDTTYEDCRCRRYGPKHRTIFVAGITLRPSQSRAEVIKVIRDFFDSNYGMVEEAALNERASSPTALVR